MITREFTEDEINVLLDDADEVDSQPWRHGRKVRYVFDHDGAYWSVWIDVHHSEGISLYGPVTATQVHKVERTVKVWEPMP